MSVLYCSYGMYSGCIIFPKSNSRPRIQYSRESNTHPTFWPSKTVKKARIRFENIRYFLPLRLILASGVTDEDHAEGNFSTTY
jgi:hypothetical protein